MGSLEDDIRIEAHLYGFNSAARQVDNLTRSTNRYTDAVKRSSTATKEADHRSFAYNQTLFTMRRYLYAATLAASSLATGVFIAGIKFDDTVERTTIALQFLSKGQFDANAEMREFLQIARDTAFLPEQVIQAGQQLIAFGFSAEETNRTLRATGDAIAALNLPQSTVDRIVLALGQIRVKGRVTGEELRQLANANIPAYQYLADAFGKNVVQIGRIADAGIPASQGIAALLTGLEKQYGGASERIRESTSGQWEILKGDTQVIFGAIVKGGFDRLATALKGLTDITGDMFTAIVYGNAGFMDLVGILDDGTGRAYHLRTVFRSVVDILNSFLIILKTIFGVLKPFLVIVLLIAYAFIQLLSIVTDFINFGGGPLIWVLRIIAIWMAVDIFVLKAYTLWTKRAVVAEKLLFFWQKRQLALFIITSTARLIGAGIMALFAAATGAAAAAMTALAGAEWAFLAPWIVIIAVILVVIGVLVILEYKFHLVSRALGWLWNKLKDFYNWVKKHNPFGFISDAVGAVSSVASLVGFQGGGMVGVAGKYMVGERGPEVVHLPAGAKVTPTSAVPMNWAGVGGAGNINVTITPAPVIVDGRQIAEVVFKHRADRLARR